MLHTLVTSHRKGRRVKEEGRKGRKGGRKGVKTGPSPFFPSPFTLLPLTLRVFAPSPFASSLPHRSLSSMSCFPN